MLRDLGGAGVRMIRSGFKGADDDDIGPCTLRLDMRIVHGADVVEELRHHRVRGAAARFNVTDHAATETESFVGVQEDFDVENVAKVRRREQMQAFDDHVVGMNDALELRHARVRDEIVDRFIESCAALGERKVLAQQAVFFRGRRIEIVSSGIEVSDLRGAKIIIVFCDHDSAGAEALGKRARNGGFTGSRAARDGDEFRDCG